jgi:hypothetical protein
MGCRDRHKSKYDEKKFHADNISAFQRVVKNLIVNDDAAPKIDQSRMSRMDESHEYGFRERTGLDSISLIFHFTFWHFFRLNL